MDQPPTRLDEFFDRQWRANPDRIALDIPPGSDRPGRVRTTYAELAGRAVAVAAALQPLVTGECLVAVLLPRTTPDAYAAPIGILRAGAAYIALDPASPDDRLRDVLEDAAVVAFVTDAAGAQRAARLGVDPARTIVVDAAGQYVGRTELWSAEHAELRSAETDEPTPPAWLTPSSLAYAIYTSGTTGRPKGVLIEHRAIANLVQSDLDEFRLSPDDRVGHGSSHAYDSSIEEIWLAFAAGATLVVIDDITIRAGPDLVEWLERERVTVLCPPPTLLRAMGRRRADSLLPRLSLLYVGGEALTRDVADVWGPGRRFVNGYGPTECAVTAIRGDVAATGVIDIGRPIAGAHAWILDDALNEVAEGQPGELCLGGAGLARGYRNAPDLTARKFPVHPVLGRIYRTGDLAYRGPDAAFVCLGRIDAQVKVRGHRVELEDIETHLSRLPGVRAAACRVAGEGARQRLDAFIVPVDPAAAPSPDDLRAALGRTLPGYMIPAHMQFVPSLPTTTGGKLDRGALPAIEQAAASIVQGGLPAAPPSAGAVSVVPPAGEVERLIESAMRQVAGRETSVSVEDDFFADLGGDSLRAAELVTALREMPVTASLTVRDVYEAPTARALAARSAIAPAPHPAHVSRRTAATQGTRQLMLAAVLQTAWILAQLVLATLVGAAIVLQGVPYGLEEIGLVPCLIAAPCVIAVALPVYAFASLLFAILFKRLLIGRYVARVEPVWSGFYIRNWIVQRTVRLVPWALFSGTVVQQAALRALGARIGQRVHLHRGVDLTQGGWDLLDIGDDVTIGQDVAIRLVELDEGQIVVAPIAIGTGATLEVRAGVGGGCQIGAGAYLTALSMLPDGGRIPAGERWDGVPAAPAGIAPDRPVVAHPNRAWTAGRYAVTLGLARVGLALLSAFPIGLVAIVAARWQSADAASLMVWLSSPVWDRSAIATTMAIAVLPVPIALVLQALAARWLSRPLTPGVISRWSGAYLRVWLVTGLVRTAGEWLSGALMWPWWLRAAGMTVGRDGEISTIIDVIPALVDIGPGCFLADGIYLAGPRVHRGTVTLSRTSLGANSFVGNHVVIASGQRLAPDLLIGVCTVADDERMRPGSSWFGHPPFAMVRPVAPMDRRLTHDPSLIRRVNRWCWELLRFAIPVVPLVAGALWIGALTSALARTELAEFVLIVAPAITAATLGGLAAVILALKWLLLGRVAPGSHALWSCWCSRWDFLYVAWQRLAAPVLVGLEGTLWLAWYLRAMGARIGRRVVLGGGFAQLVDPDMLQIDDEATVHAMFQAHTFEDRVLKIDRIRIRRRATVGDGAVLFYGADIGEDTFVAPHSVVMKREHLHAGVAYEGCPIRPV